MHAAEDSAGPAQGADRIVAIDALRGFALLGILFANLPYWAGLPFGTDEQRAAILSDIPREVFGVFFNGVLDGKFYTLFSTLFGLGFALQLDRLEKRGTDGLRIFRRRMAALLAIGIAHMLLVWDGDILTLYAALGFALPLFRHRSDRALVGWAFTLLFLVPLVGVWATAAAGISLGAPFFALGGMIAAPFGIGPDTNMIAYGTSGGWQHWLGWQAGGWAFSLGDRLETWRIFKVLGCMVLGLLAGRMLVRGTLLGNRRLLAGVPLGGLAIGLPAMSWYVTLPPHSQTSWSSLIGTAPLGLAYGAAFLLAWPIAAPVLSSFAPVGRMALTNYLTHSVVCGVVAFGYGFGLMGRVPMLSVYAGGLGLYVLQMAFSAWWLTDHAQGPVEALWRRMTYGAKLPGRLAPA